MKVKILGGHGGVSDSTHATSFLVNDDLLIDAGSIASASSIEVQQSIDHILISHSHLDHIKDLAFLCDNCFGLKDRPFEVYSHPLVVSIIKHHLFNETIWPDFSKLPNIENPTIRFNEVNPEQPFEVGGYKVLPVSVNHPNEAMGYIIEKEDSAVLFTLDTASTDKIWEYSHKFKNLKAIFTEVSFPNNMDHIARASYHHTPKSLGEELKKMPKGIPVILTHLKPNFREQLLKEITELNEPRVQLLEKDGVEYSF